MSAYGKEVYRIDEDGLMLSFKEYIFADGLELRIEHLSETYKLSAIRPLNRNSARKMANAILKWCDEVEK